jgi:hypothetical protein
MTRFKRRVNLLFAALRSEGYLARKGACCNTCSQYELEELAKSQDKLPLGVVFYHDQNVERDLPENRLPLGYFTLSDNRTATRKLGEHVARRARDFGFAVDWNGSPDQKVTLMEAH